MPIDELDVQLFCDDLTLLDHINVLPNNSHAYFIVWFADDSTEVVYKLT